MKSMRRTRRPELSRTDAICAARKGGGWLLTVLSISRMLVSASSAERKGAMAVSGPDSPNATMSTGWPTARPVITVMSRESTSPAASSFLAVAELTILVLPASSAPDILRAARSDFTRDMYCGHAVRCDRPDLYLLFSGTKAREQSRGVYGRELAADLTLQERCRHDDRGVERVGHTRLEHVQVASRDTAGHQRPAHCGITGDVRARGELSSDPGHRVAPDHGRTGRRGTSRSGALPGPALLPGAALFPLWWNTAKPRTSAPAAAVATRTPATR